MRTKQDIIDHVAEIMMKKISIDMKMCDSPEVSEFDEIIVRGAIAKLREDGFLKNGNNIVDGKNK